MNDARGDNTQNHISDLPSGKAAVLLLAFNRPQATTEVLSAIGQYAPARLYVAMDGPRINNDSDRNKVQLVKQVVTDWEAAHPDTVVTKLYRTENLGCGKAVSSGITWFFEQEEMGIILEDDCKPIIDFFRYCEELLVRYKHNEQVMHIGGSGFLPPRFKTEDSYYFSKYPHIWGWATWRKAWQKYQFDMPAFDSFIQLPDFNRFYDADIFIKTHNGQVDTWDSQWVYTLLMNNGLSILPFSNLVKNIGFEENKGVHLAKKPTWYSGAVFELGPLKHPQQVVQNKEADDYVFKKLYKRGARYRIRQFIRRLLLKKR